MGNNLCGGNDSSQKDSVPNSRRKNRRKDKNSKRSLASSHVSNDDRKDVSLDVLPIGVDSSVPNTRDVYGDDTPMDKGRSMTASMFVQPDAELDLMKQDEEVEDKEDADVAVRMGQNEEEVAEEDLSSISSSDISEPPSPGGRVLEEDPQPLSSNGGLEASGKMKLSENLLKLKHSQDGRRQKGPQRICEWMDEMEEASRAASTQAQPRRRPQHELPAISPQETQMKSQKRPSLGGNDVGENPFAGNQSRNSFVRNSLSVSSRQSTCTKDSEWMYNLDELGKEYKERMQYQHNSERKVRK